MATFEYDVASFEHMMKGRTPKMDLIDSVRYFNRQLKFYYPEISARMDYILRDYPNRKPFSCLVVTNKGERMIFIADPSKQYGMMEDYAGEG